MLDFIVLGQIPGTEFRLGLISILSLMGLALITYLLIRYPQIARKTQEYLRAKKSRAFKSLARLWHNVFSPKPKLLK